MKTNLFLQRKFIYGIIILALFILAGLNFIGWFFIQGFKNDLTKSLKQQIVHTGSITTRLINGNDLENIVPGMENSPLVIYYQQLLYDIKTNNDLENIVILDPAGRLLVDHRLNFHIGDSLYTFPMNQNLFRSATTGRTPEPLLIHTGNQYFLSAYFPIFNDLDVPTGVLVIDAPLRFFATLHRLEVGLFYLGAGGLGILILFSTLILLATRRLLTAEIRLKEQERLAQLGQMAASVAHEIRNPLSIMKGAADVLLKKYGQNAEELFSFIPEEINRLNRLVENFLQFSRRKELSPKPHSVNKLIRETVEPLNDQRITLKFSDHLPDVPIDPDAFKQILLNLIQNALDAIAADGKVNILTSRNRSRNVVVEITDNGKGIPPEQLALVFEPFYSTKAQGSGLGLAITRQLVEQMGGEIRIESQPGKGTTVRIILKG